MPSVVVSIVTYNSAVVIADCLQSISADLPVYIVDNGSTDDTLAVVRKTRPDANIIKPRRNLGFGRAHNQVFRRTNSDFVLVLNPDTILKPDCMTHLLATAEIYPDAGIIGALHEQRDGTINACFRNDHHCYRQLARYPAQLSAASQMVPTAPICVEQITGALMLIRRSTLAVTKGFQRHLFMYFEDDDLCARTRLAGFSVILDPRARVVHLEGRSTYTRSYRVDCIKGYHFERSRKIVHAVYRGRTGYCSLILSGLWRCLRRATRYRLKNDIGRTVYYLAGMLGLLSPLPRVKRLKT